MVNEAKINTSAVRGRLERMLTDRTGASPEVARKFSLDMTDWLDDAVNLLVGFSSIDNIDDELLYNLTMRILIHAPSHIVAAAAAFTGESVQEMLNPVSNRQGIG